VLGAHNAHMQHVWKSDIGGERAAARHQRTVLETSYRAADEGHVRPSLLNSLQRSSPRARTQRFALDSRFRGNERSFAVRPSYLKRLFFIGMRRRRAAPRGCAAGLPE